jgi:branched-chain amino acid transport system permease protein
MNEFLQQLINGLGTGSTYALWAVGYGLVFQVLGLMHFAHGDTLLVGLYVLFAMLVSTGTPLALAIAVSMIAAALVAMVVERVVYRPLVRKGDAMSAFSAALAAAYVLRNVATLIWGSDAKAFPKFVAGRTMHVGDLVFNTTPFLTLAITLAVVFSFRLFLDRLRWGQAIVMIGQDRATSSLMGIPTYRTISYVYALSGAIGMIGAMMYVGRYGALTPITGLSITLKAFVAALLGGIGRLEGALAGGLLLGVLESFISGYVSSLYADAIVFGLLAIILLVRPSGLLGRKELVKL